MTSTDLWVGVVENDLAGLDGDDLDAELLDSERHSVVDFLGVPLYAADGRVQQGGVPDTADLR